MKPGLIPGFQTAWVDRGFETRYDTRFLVANTRIPYAEARDLFSALAPAHLPAVLRDLSDLARETRWPSWLAEHDRAIRERLFRGDEDTVTLWMALGTSFTREPRVTDVMAASPDDGAALIRVVQARARDFVALLGSRATGDRAAFARQLLVQRGSRFDDDATRRGAEQYLIQRLAALLKEQRELAARLRAARQAGDRSAEFAARSTLFHERGLSLDTSLAPNLAIGDALDAIRRSGLLGSRSVTRVAIVGPGLDFADKDTGFDFYPVQTVQPFAVYEALLRAGLASRDRLELSTFDLSPRVNQHLEAARARAARGDAYRIVLPLDRRPWTADAVRFWKSFGDMLGSADSPPTIPAGVAADVRAVRIAPAILARITPVDLNIVVDRLQTAPFDLIVATNVLVYYGVFEQALALANIEAMLRPGGLLLTNSSLPELPGSSMRSAGDSTTVYSDRPGDGDHVVWYRRQ